MVSLQQYCSSSSAHDADQCGDAVACDEMQPVVANNPHEELGILVGRGAGGAGGGSVQIVSKLAPHSVMVVAGAGGVLPSRLPFRKLLMASILFDLWACIAGMCRAVVTGI